MLISKNEYTNSKCGNSGYFEIYHVTPPSDKWA